MLVIVTRPAAQAADWVAALTAAGHTAAAVPLLAIAEAPDAAAVRAAWADLAADDLVMFVSPNAVASFFAAAPGAAWPAGVLAGATGPGTSAALRRAGVPDALIVEPGPDGPFDSEGLWAQLVPRRAWAGARVSVVRGEGGRDWFADTLRGQRATVRFIEAYRRVPPVLDAAAADALARALRAPDQACWLFSSSEALGHLAELAPQVDWHASRALATHPRIAAAARALGFGDVREIAPGLPAALQALATL